MQQATLSPADILKENEELRARLDEAEELLRAIRSGDVDALVVESDAGPQVYVLQGHDAKASRFRGEMLEQVSDAVVAVNASGLITFFNAAAARLYGLTASKALARPLAEVYSTEWLAPEDETAAATALRENGEWHGETVHVRHDGHTMHVEASITGLRGGDGQEAGRLAVIRDVSEKRQHEKRVLVSEIRYRRLFEAAHDGVLILDPATRKIIDANPFMIQLLGYRRDELIGMELHEIGFLADAQASRAMFEALKTTPQVRYENLPLQTRQGALRDVEMVGNLYDEGGHPILQYTVRDITERKVAEVALREREEQLRLSLKAANAGSWDWHVPSSRIRWSPENYVLHGIEPRPDGPRYSDWEATIHPEDREAANRAVRDVLERRAAEFKAEFRILQRDGTIRWLLGLGNIERAGDGSPLRMSGINIDITERKRQEEHIKLLIGEVNHRSKNMLSLVQAIARRTVATRPEDFVERFGERVRALATNQDLLVMSDWRAVSIGELVRSQLGPFSDAGDARVVLDGLPVEVTASASQALGMALHELATNAAKYGALSNQAGRVAISWRLTSDAAGKARFTMSWTESGGPPVAKPTRHGFGSTVTGSMIKMSLGCDADIDFAPSGLVWRIDCPAAGLIEGSATYAPEWNAAALNDQPSQPSARRSVLVVEDEPLIAMDIAQTLEEAGYDVIGPAHSVAAALALLAHSGCDAAVLDVNLGAETSEPVARELIRRGMPFITTSGYAREQQPEVMRTAPLIGKPVKPGLLIAEIGRCMGK